MIPKWEVFAVQTMCLAKPFHSPLFHGWRVERAESEKQLTSTTIRKFPQFLRSGQPANNMRRYACGRSGMPHFLASGRLAHVASWWYQFPTSPSTAKSALEWRLGQEEVKNVLLGCCPLKTRPFHGVWPAKEGRNEDVYQHAYADLKRLGSPQWKPNQ